MATGTVVVLDDFVVSVGGQDVSDQVRSLTLNVSANMLDVTSGDSGGWTETRPGLKSWTATLDIIASFGSNEISTLLWTAISTGASVAFVGRADGGSVSADNPSYSGTAYNPGFDLISGSVGDVNGTSVTLTGSGALTQATS